MANFGQLVLTNVGIQEQYKAQSGEPLKFKRIAMGSGTYTGNIMALTQLVTENVSVAISKGYMQNNAFFVEGFFSNEGLQIGFAWREIGLFVEDASGNEVLYCYANAGDSYDYIPATADERYSKYIRIATVIGNATNVSIIENEGITYVDAFTFNEKMASINEDIKKAAPHNLLGNSDFSNPVNRKGETSYTGSGYGIDLWTSRSGYSAVTISDGCVNIKSTNGTTAAYVLQFLASGKIKSGKIYTAVCELKDGSTHFLTAQASVGMEEVIRYIYVNGEQLGTFRFRYDSSESMYAVMFSTLKTTGMDIVNVALYEGEYTAETLPEYQPKGYNVELLNCGGYVPTGLHRSYGSLKDIGITKFPTTMKTVIDAMPTNSIIVIDTRRINGANEATSTETISDWGNTVNGVAIIAKGYSEDRVSLYVSYSTTSADKVQFHYGNFAYKANAVNWGKLVPFAWESIWTNASPTSTFAAQNICNVKDYDAVMVVTRLSASYGYENNTFMFTKSWGGGFSCFPQKATDGVSNERSRYFDVAGDGTLSAGTAYTVGSQDNTACIPVAVYGINW